MNCVTPSVTARMSKVVAVISVLSIRTITIAQLNWAYIYFLKNHIQYILKSWLYFDSAWRTVLARGTWCISPSIPWGLNAWPRRRSEPIYLASSTPTKLFQLELIHIRIRRSSAVQVVLYTRHEIISCARGEQVDRKEMGWIWRFIRCQGAPRMKRKPEPCAAIMLAAMGTRSRRQVKLQGGFLSVVHRNDLLPHVQEWPHWHLNKEIPLILKCSI
jgi:hypothetical protein